MAEEKKNSLASISLVMIVLFAFLMYTVAFSVPFTHTAVVTTLGKVTRTISGESEPGLEWKWPWPIENVKMYDNRLRVHESKLEQLFTADEQSITVTIYTVWKISPIKENVIRYLKEIDSPDKAQRILTGLAHDAMGKVIGKHNFEDFISTDLKKMKFNAIEKELRKMIEDQALVSYGIDVSDVGIKRLELPEEASKKVFDRMRQEREQLAKKFRAQGKGQARQIRARANRRASDIENRATAEAITIRGEGDVAAAKYYEIFKQHPELHNFIKRLETLKEILPKRSTLILDAANVPPFDMIGADVIKWLTKQESGKTPDKK